jgi:hypothetical protein
VCVHQLIEAGGSGTVGGKKLSITASEKVMYLKFLFYILIFGGRRGLIYSTLVM